MLTCSCRLDAGHYPLDTVSRATFTAREMPNEQPKGKPPKTYIIVANGCRWYTKLAQTDSSKQDLVHPCIYNNTYHIVVYISLYPGSIISFSLVQIRISRYITEAQSSNGESCFCGTLALGHRRTAILRITASRMHWQIFQNSPR